MTALEFRAVRCPGDGAVVMEVATGLSRGKCPKCRRRVWAMANGHEVRVGMVDTPAVRLVS